MLRGARWALVFMALVALLLLAVDRFATSIVESDAGRAFLSDEATALVGTEVGYAGAAGGSEYLNTLQLMANAVDWSLEDAGLLSIRARSHFNRTLPPMEHASQLFWEYLNYVLAALALVVVALLQRRRSKARQRQYQQLVPANS